MYDGRGDAGYRMGVRMEGSCLKKASVYPLYYILSSALMFSLLESIVRERDRLININTYSGILGQSRFFKCQIFTIINKQ